jgi:hypothetical protein
MTDGNPADRLSAKRQFVLVVRLVVQAHGKVTGELVDPLTLQRQRFAEFDHIVDAVHNWIDDARSTAATTASQLKDKPAET